MAEEIGSGLSLKNNPFSYEPSPELQAVNASQALKFQEQTAPLAKAVEIIANPQASGEDRVFAADQLKSVANRSEFRFADFIQSVLNLNIRDAIISATGGTHTRTEARDQDGNLYYKIFNQRITKQNPFGEVVGYEDSKFQPLSQKDLEGKVIVSQVEVPLTQRPFYQANNISAKQAATAQAENWVKLQNKSALINSAYPELNDVIQQNKRLLPGLTSLSTDPKTRTLLAGASEMRTGYQTQVQASLEKLKEARNATEFNEAKEEFKRNSGGITIGINWTEGKGKTDTNRNVVSDTDIERIGRSAMSSISASNAITATRDNLLERAQALALEGKIQNFDAVQKYINNEYKKSLLINRIEDAGGIGIATPNIPFKTGDSFALAYAKNESDSAYSDLAKHFADKINERQARFGNTSPPGIGMIEAEVGQSPYVKDRKNLLFQDLEGFEKSYKPIAEEINKRSVSPQLLAQPSTATTNQGAAATPRVPALPEEPVIAGAKPPVAKPANKTEPAKKPRPLGAIFQ